jgi:Protein of unknown function (DUF3810)
VKLLRIALVLLALAAALVPMPPGVVERWYSQRAYLAFQPAVTRFSSLVPVALLDIAIAISLLLLIVVFVRRLRTAGAFVAVGRTLVTLIVAAAVFYLWFLALWGLNYRRVPLEQKIAYDQSRVGRDQALRIGRLAVEQVNALKAPALPSPDDRDLSIAFAGVQRDLGALTSALVAQPKRSLLTWYFRKAAFDGMTDPWFLEVIVNPDVLPFERPFVLAHEWAHLAGYSDESEANFIALIACVRASPSARYSGWLSAYEYAASALPRDDRRALAASLSPAVVADLAAARERLALASPTVSMAARGAYDKYLRANRIQEGIANYNAVVRLMLGTAFDLNWKPELRQ